MMRVKTGLPRRILRTIGARGFAETERRLFKGTEAEYKDAVWVNRGIDQDIANYERALAYMRRAAQPPETRTQAALRWAAFVLGCAACVAGFIAFLWILPILGVILQALTEGQ